MMTSTSKKMAAVVLAVTVAMSLSACSGNPPEKPVHA